MNEQVQQNRQMPLRYVNKWSLYKKPVMVAAIINAEGTYFNLYLQFMVVSNTIYAVLTLGEYTQPGKHLSVPLEHQDNCALKIMTRGNPRSVIDTVAERYASIRYEKLWHRFIELNPWYTTHKIYSEKRFDDLVSIDHVRTV